jgi:hypothetical protein
MCEYSLHSVPNRLAVEGEQLVTYRFPTFTIGLASVAQIEAGPLLQSRDETGRSWWSVLKSWLSAPHQREDVVAVCIPPGAHLRVSGFSKHTQNEFRVGPAEEITFVELSADAYQYRDAIQFQNGRTLILQLLDEGVRFEVLSLDSTEPDTAAREPEATWELLPLRMTEFGR